MSSHSAREMRICFVGDSFVAGAGDPTYLGWAGRLCAEARRDGFDITYYNLGVRRDTSADICRRWLAEVDPRLPESYDRRVVFSFGVNDTTIEGERQRVALEQTLANARAIVRGASERYPTLFVGPPPIADPAQNERTRALSGHLSQICAGEGVPYLETFDTLLSTPVWMREVADGDGAHPGEAGYAALAEVVRQ